MRTNVKLLVKCIALPLFVGALSALLTKSGMEYFKEELVKPPLMPPSWMFSVVWTILYAMMGYASYLVLEDGTGDQKTARTLYVVQLGFNFFWSIFFFCFRWFLFSFAWLVLLWFLVLGTMKSFAEIEPRAGKLIVPYLAWVSFAGYLNFAVYLLN